MITRNLQLLPKVVCCSLCGYALDPEYTDPEYTCATESKVVQRLSVRETQVVDLIQQAKSNKEIAYQLGLTTGTVKEYLFHIFRKLGISNRTELALWKRDSAAKAAFSG